MKKKRRISLSFELLKNLVKSEVIRDEVDLGVGEVDEELPLYLVYLAHSYS